MTPEDIADLVEVSEPRLSPDGLEVAFVVTTVDVDANRYRSQVWVIPVDGSVPPRPLTAGDHRDTKPRWSPDGRLVAFVSHREDRGSGLYVMPVKAGGELVKAAVWAEEIEDVEWSPDGSCLAFTARVRDEARYGPERDADRPSRRINRLVYRLDGVGWTADRPRQLFVVPASGQAVPRQLTHVEAGVAGAAWSPDGSRLAYAAATHDTWDTDQRVDLFMTDVSGGRPIRLTPTDAAFGRPSFSPDGTLLAFTWGNPAQYPGHGQIGVVPVDGGAVRLLTEQLDRQCTPFLPGTREPVWDGGRVLFLVEDAGNTHLSAMVTSGGPPTALIAGDRQVTGFDARGGVVVFCASSSTSLPELYALAGTDERRLTSFSQSFTAKHAPPVPERFVAEAADGAEVEAWILRPDGYEDGRRYPTILNIHGGPFTQYGNRVFDEFLLQTGAGYAVIYSNPRGSSGYSAAWAQAICGPESFAPGTGWGGADYDDLMAVAAAATERFSFVDGDRLGVMGGSYGGYMTSWMVSHTDRFKAACSERAVNNHLSFSWTSDIGARFPKCYIGPSHIDDPDEYLRQSPITYVRNIRTPLLILHAENDLRCPVEQAEQLYVALKLLGGDVEFVRFPGEGHELSRSGSPRHRIERMQVILDFFNRRL